MIKIPGTRYKMLKTEVTQELYESVMGENPSFFKTGSERYKYKNGDDFIMLNGEDEKKLPVEQVSWYDAIYFCNKLSEMQGLTPVYSVKGSTDVTKWGYTPHKGNAIDEHVKWNKSANGYRLPTWDEHDYAANGGQNHTYPGSNDIYEVCWYAENSADRTHSVAQKNPMLMVCMI
ncbi:MAG: SUMF1/EgtB/PvdO family nonheme iron enzyme [Treponema sp.]|nr:SUMF1/EgtB/PvdO family nonheme iron enzyme [Treponema sp.]